MKNTTSTSAIPTLHTAEIIHYQIPREAQNGIDIVLCGKKENAAMTERIKEVSCKHCRKIYADVMSESEATGMC